MLTKRHLEITSLKGLSKRRILSWLLLFLGSLLSLSLFQFEIGYGLQFCGELGMDQMKTIVGVVKQTVAR